MFRSLVLPLVALALGVVACGGATVDPSQSPNPSEPTEPLVCGGATARISPVGDTYDDTKGVDSVRSVRFEMFVYADASGSDAGTDAGPSARPPSLHECPSAGLLARSFDAVEVVPGDYWLCNEAGACGCVRARLTGGPVSCHWGAGPGGGHLEVRGCGTALQ